MQRLRTTFKRSRTPTGAEMKTQSSLEVPKQVRSASFDEIQLEAKRQQQPDLLRVPQFTGQRSRSVDSGEESATYLEVPSRRFQRRRSSGAKVPVCVHCLCLEEYTKTHPPEKPPPDPPDYLVPCPAYSVSDTSSSECDDEGMVRRNVELLQKNVRDFRYSTSRYKEKGSSKGIETPSSII